MICFPSGFGTTFYSRNDCSLNFTTTSPSLLQFLNQMKSQQKIFLLTTIPRVLQSGHLSWLSSRTCTDRSSLCSVGSLLPLLGWCTFPGSAGFARVWLWFVWGHEPQWGSTASNWPCTATWWPRNATERHSDERKSTRTMGLVRQNVLRIWRVWRVC